MVDSRDISYDADDADDDDDDDDRRAVLWSRMMRCAKCIFVSRMGVLGREHRRDQCSPISAHELRSAYSGLPNL